MDGIGLQTCYALEVSCRVSRPCIFILTPVAPNYTIVIPVLDRRMPTYTVRIALTCIDRAVPIYISRAWLLVQFKVHTTATVSDVIYYNVIR